MACSNPFYLPSVVDYRGVSVPLRCGYCMNCRQDYVNSWALRAEYEFTHRGRASSFVTLTFNDFWLGLECINKGYRRPTVRRLHMHKFIDNLRHSVPSEYRNFSYFLVGEYGGKFNRPHYHLCLFGLPYAVADKYVSKIWHFGSTSTKPFKSSGAIRYCLKYMFKETLNKFAMKRKYFDTGRTPPFISRSKGFGSGFFYDNVKSIRDHKVIRLAGKVYPVPAYWKNKFFNFDRYKEVEKERLDYQLAKFRQFRHMGFKNYSEMNAYFTLAKEKTLVARAVSRREFVPLNMFGPEKDCYKALLAPPLYVQRDNFNKLIIRRF